MSRICQLTGTRRMKRNKIAIERSKVTKRTKGFANVNLHTKRFKTSTFGNVKFRISNRTMRTIEKYGNLECFLVKMKRGALTPEARKLRKTLWEKKDAILANI